MIAQIFKWLTRGFVVAVIAGGMIGCTQLGLNYASLETDNKPIPQPALGDSFDADAARATLEAELYGPWPADLPISAAPARMIDDNYLGGRGTLEEVLFTIGEGDAARTFPVVLALPNSSADTPVPLLISQTFADNCSAFDGQPLTAPDGTVCDGPMMSGFGGFLATRIFGTYIAKVPVERYFDAGFGYASFYGPGFVPDRNGDAQAVMAAFGSDAAPTATLMAWAYAFHATGQVFSADPRIDGARMGALGHSRYGKSALIAAAWSDTIQAAIAHQSGFAGAASSRSTKGETLGRMARSYPHWLRPGIGEYLEEGGALTLDQHYLLALTAPKPIFLGNGRRDVWSDPNSTYMNALAADTVYEAQGLTGLPEGDMRTFDPSAEIAYWLRVGGHSVVSEDIDAFIAFASAHLNGAP